MNRKERFEQVDLYPVTCEALSEGRGNLEVLDAVIVGGAKIVQLREKELSKRAFHSMASAFRKRCTEAGLLFIVNDHLDVALSVGADGVHLGQDDFPLPEARRLAPDLLLGASTHTREQALAAARDGADYYNIGPIYPTGTKEHLSEFLGPEAVPGISQGIDLPFTVMGGIKHGNVEPLLERGARRIAVVTEITKAQHMVLAVKRMIQIIRAAGP